MDVPKKDDR
jgi:hypothetical protein